jgi:hypothetical protein
MQGPSVTVHTDDEDEVITIDQRSRPGSFVRGIDLGTDMLINKAKVSREVLSQSSGSESGDSEPRNRFGFNSDNSGGGGSDSGSEYTETDDATPTPQEQTFGFGAPRFPSAAPQVDRMANERARVEAELNEKKELLYQMDRLEARGFRLPKRFTLQSDLEEMRTEYHRIVREKEVDASVRFQRKMTMLFVTGVETLNDRFNPFNVTLNGWSEKVHEDIADYDDIFEELHEKYKSSGKSMPPEVRLLMGLGGSAFMFHLSNNMFKRSQVPAVESVLKSDPALLKAFQQAAARQYTEGMTAAANLSSPAPAAGGGMFGMLSGLFGGGGGGGGFSGIPQRETMPQPRKMQGPRTDIDDIINDVQLDIDPQPPKQQQQAQSRIETMSFSDEEITSLIESEIDGVLSNGSGAPKRAQRGRPAAKKRTLSL